MTRLSPGSVKFNLPDDLWPGEPEVVLEYTYDSGQKQVLHPDEKAQPGIEPSVEVAVMFGPLDLTDIFADHYDIIYDQMEEACMDDARCRLEPRDE